MQLRRMVAKFFSKLFCCFFKRMEKERIEKELAEKFSHQLHLESNKLNIFEQEDAEIDEFPGEFYFFLRLRLRRIYKTKIIIFTRFHRRAKRMH